MKETEGNRENRRSINVLVTASGTVTCQAVIKALRNQSLLDVELTVTDCDPRNAGRYLADRWCRVPKVSDPSYLDVLLGLVEEHHIGLFIPIFDLEFPLIARERRRFEALGCQVAISSPETIETCNDKVQTARFFAANGFPAPPLVSVEEARAGRCRFPLILKYRHGRASIGVQVLNGPGEVDGALARAEEEAILQEKVSGQEITVDVLCDLAGVPIGVVPRTRIEVKSGVSSKGRSFHDDRIIGEAVRMAKALGLRGHANLQAFLGEDGAISWIEVNPRFSGALPLTLASGLNSPALLALSALGERVEPAIGAFREVVMLRYWEEVFAEPDGGERLDALPVSIGRRG